MPPKVVTRCLYHTKRPAYVAMGAVIYIGHGHPIGALYKHHSLNCDITWLAKCPLEKQIGQSNLMQ